MIRTSIQIFQSSYAVSLWLLTSLSMETVFLNQMHHPQSSHTGNRVCKTHYSSLTCKTAHTDLSLILGNKKVYSLGFIWNTASQVRTKEIGLHIVDNHFSGCPSKILFWSWWDYISYRDWGGNLDSVFTVVLE